MAPKSVWMIIAIWLLAIGSLLGTHYFLHHKPRPNRTRIAKMEAKLKSLTDDQKIKAVITWFMTLKFMRNMS